MTLDCYCDYDPPTVYRSSMQRAAKVYRCEECSARILPGEQYEYVFGVYDGYASTFRTCSDCVALRKWLRTNVPCFCWAHGNLIQDCRDTIDAAYQKAADEDRCLAVGVGRLLVKAKRNRQSMQAAEAA